MGIAKLHKARGLVGSIGVNRAAQVQRIVGQQANGTPLHPRQRRVDAFAKTGAQRQQRVHVCNALQRSTCVVGAQAVLGHHGAQG